MTPQASRLPLARRAVGPGVPVPTLFGTLFGFWWLTARAHTQHACAIILPRSTLSLGLPTGSATPPFRGVRASSRSLARAVTGVSAPHRPAKSGVRSPCAQAIYLDLSQAYWVALRANRKPCTRYCILLRALGTATAAKGLSGPFYAALTLCFGTQAWPHFWGRRWHPFLRALRLGLRSSGVLARRVRRPHPR